MTDQSQTPSPGSVPPTDEMTALPYNRLSWWLDKFIVAVGKLASWIWVLVLITVLSNVFSRFVMEEGSIALEELSWHLFGAALMLTLAYAAVRDDHVRVDVLHEKFRPRSKAWVDLLGIVFLALPVLIITIQVLIPYAHTAFIYDERSQAPSGLPHRFIIKSIVPIGLALIAVALFSRALRCCTLLFGFPRVIRPSGPPPDSPDSQ